MIYYKTCWYMVKCKALSQEALLDWGGGRGPLPLVGVTDTVCAPSRPHFQAPPPLHRSIFSTKCQFLFLSPPFPIFSQMQNKIISIFGSISSQHLDTSVGKNFFPRPQFSKQKNPFHRAFYTFETCTKSLVLNVSIELFFNENI